jgi:hypothetical protein
MVNYAGLSKVTQRRVEEREQGEAGRAIVDGAAGIENTRTQYFAWNGGKR